MFVLLAICVLIVPRQVLSSKQQYGYYNPFPPGNDQVVYEFSPVSDKGFQDESSEGHRAQRDLAWKEYSAYMNGEAEPTCEDLRRMFQLARKLHQKALATNEIPQEINPFAAISAKEARVGSGSPETMVPVAENFSNFSPQKANRRRFSNPTASTAAGIQFKQQEKENSKISADTKDSSDEVYGIVHEAMPKEKSTFPPENTLQVRDPAKEIFGLIRDRDRDGQRHHHQSSNVYGSVRTHSPSKTDQPNSYLDVLQQKLFGRNPTDSDSGEAVYGKVRQYQSEPSPSSFETVRGMISSTNGNHNHHHNHHHHNNNNNNNNNNPPDSGMFDVVRERLLNSRHRHAILNNESHNNSDNHIKSLRRKNSRKRRRNAEEIAELEKQILKDYMTFRRSSTALEKTEKKNHRKSINRKNEAKSNLQKEREREKTRRKNLLLQKLG